MDSSSLSSLNALWGKMVGYTKFNAFNIPKICVCGRNATEALHLGKYDKEIAQVLTGSYFALNSRPSSAAAPAPRECPTMIISNPAS